MLTVLLATRNRASVLRDILEKYCRLQTPGSGWKLVVVDNGSKDETAQVIASFAARLPLHSVFEPQLGKNIAINAGIEHVEGDLTILTDDDAFPKDDWLVALRNAADTHPECTIFGGAIIPRWQSTPPSWMHRTELGVAYALTDPSLSDGPITPGLVFGPNMAIRSAVFQAGMRLDPSLGPRGVHYAMGGETEFVLRLHRQGHRAWYVSGAIVEHLIREEQMQKSWVLRRAVRWGRGLQRMYPVKSWWGIPRHLLRDIPKELVVLAAALVTFRQDARMRARWRLGTLWGKGIEARIMAREPRTNHGKCAASDGSLSPHS